MEPVQLKKTLKQRQALFTKLYNFASMFVDNAFCRLTGNKFAISYCDAYFTILNLWIYKIYFERVGLSRTMSIYIWRYILCMICPRINFVFIA